MGGSEWFLLALLVGMIVLWFQWFLSLTDEQQDEYMAKRKLGDPNPHIICPHCQQKGEVRTKPVEQKTGISGGKATAAVLTGGFSLLATGLSRKQQMTEAHCMNCNSTWRF